MTTIIHDCIPYNEGQYMGSFLNDVPHGYGIFLIDGIIIYIGQWKKGKKHGKGKYYFNNNDMYHGNFVHDIIDGEGILFHKNEIVYSGFWKNGKNTIFWNKKLC